ncbi:nucleotide pyrophosphohydrolase [bacterium]|nr:nucleotide pyrophosphohydrolase [bacterium]
MSNKNITFEKVVQQLHSFRKERGWLGLAPVDLAKSIILEAAELLEHYQWDGTDVKRKGSTVKKNKHEVASEVADIFIYILEFCQENDIDLLEVTAKKIEHNSKKYSTKDMKNGSREAYESVKKNYRKNN